MFAIVVPILGRAERAQLLISSIRSSSTLPHRTLLVLSPNDPTNKDWQRTGADWIIAPWEPGPGDFAKKMNLGYRETEEAFIFLGASDLEFTPGWDIAALEVANETGLGVIGTQDNCNPVVKKGQHATHPLVSREYIRDMGGTIDGTGEVYCELYDHQCNPPDAPIWMADLSFKPIGAVQIGDAVIGWTRSKLNPQEPELISAIQAATGSQRQIANEFGVSPTHVHAIRKGYSPALTSARHDASRPWRVGLRKLEESIVLSIQCREAPLIDVSFESGRSLRCTADHLWLNPNWHPSTRSREWIEARVGSHLMHVIEPMPTLTREQERLGGWLGGIFDGEGSWHPSPQIGQSLHANSEVYQEICRALDLFGFSYTRKPDRLWLNGGWRELVRFLNIAQPVKHRDRLIEYVSHARRFGQRDRIVGVEPAGWGEVVSLMTETGNYVAHGYASKNCVDNELIELAQSRGQWAFASRSVVIHHHPMYDRTSKMDATYTKALAKGKDDRMLFMRRRRLWQGEARQRQREAVRARR